MKQSTIIFAVDIEARGLGPYSNGIISIGVCVGRSDKEVVIEKIRFDIAPLYHQTMDPICYSEFWSKNKTQYTALTKNALPAKSQIPLFRSLLDKYDVDHNVYIVSDNPAFDFGMINYYLDIFELPTLSHKRVGDTKVEYRKVHDADSYGRGLLGYTVDQPWLGNRVIAKHIGTGHINIDDHDHMPENDAEIIYKIHRVCLLIKNSK